MEGIDLLREGIDLLREGIDLLPEGIDLLREGIDLLREGIDPFLVDINALPVGTVPVERRGFSPPWLSQHRRAG